MTEIKTILVLCTGNSARSILGEALFNVHGKGRLKAYSAGSKPKGEPHPAALRLLDRKGLDTRAFSSKSWDAFTGSNAPHIDVAITVCANAANEVCPVFWGSPLRAHWGLADPAEVSGSDEMVDAAFAETWRLLELRVKAFFSHNLGNMSDDDVRAILGEIGRMEGAA
jgi:arsenate reductase (thioredoxin)